MWTHTHISVPQQRRWRAPLQQPKQQACPLQQPSSRLAWKKLVLCSMVMKKKRNRLLLCLQMEEPAWHGAL